jgi:Leucine-rich repeat (LRR) protein
LIRNKPKGVKDLSDVKLIDKLQKMIHSSIQKVDSQKNLIEVERGYYEENEKVIGLTLKYCNLTHFPDLLIDLSHLQYLDISNNNLNELPETLGNLTTLEELRVTQNRLKTLPNNIENLTNLKKLYLRGNQITQVPEGLWQVKQIEELDIGGGNQLAVISNNIGYLTKLTKLYFKKACCFRYSPWAFRKPS